MTAYLQRQSSKRYRTLSRRRAPAPFTEYYEDTYSLDYPSEFSPLKGTRIEDYLNTSRRLNDTLHQRGIILHKKVIFTQYLNNLNDNYENIITNIMQTLRNNIEAYTLDDIISNLLDKANRIRSKIQDSVKALVTSLKKNIHLNKSKRPYKVTKQRYCRNCKRTNHIPQDCLDLFPEKIIKK
ncbi:hypothetical protein EV44_g3140 [Erysiphe necator]|uniref:Uncharacterized protein n=1 Tax=Uncinula necator TaxID=52586 RepID=A0A0B1PFR4_UNCNE|nr:hypothetical protein EV44_g3140 [Erysiphe necator]